MTTVDTELAAVRRVADAVLYEGYLLYPYRASSSKNQVRWQFGVLGPVGAAAAGVGEEPSLHTECLLLDERTATLDVHVRFLHTQWRAVQASPDGGATFLDTEELQVGGTRWIGWHEAVERELVFAGVTVPELLAGRELPVTVRASTDTEVLRDHSGAVVGRLVRRRWPLSARLGLGATPVSATPNLLVLRLTLTNQGAWLAGAADATVSRSAVRDLAARESLVGAHFILRTSGRFVSTVDPPDWAVAAAAGCSCSRCWPVLAGTRDEDGAQTSQTLLAAPIILYDHPVVADESPGDLFDATEIDEILTLRIMTLTEDEKAAARGTDPKAAAIIDRSDQMPPEVFERLHGTLRGYGVAPPPEPQGSPWWDPAEDASVSPGTDAVLVGDVPVAAGSRVVLRPSRRADAQDLFLAGMHATVRAVLSDVDGGTHAAVTLDDDPAGDLHDWYGRYYYFAPDELEPLVGDALQRGELP